MSGRYFFYLGASVSTPLLWAVVVDGEITETGILDDAGALVKFAEARPACANAYGVIQGEQVCLRTMVSPPKSNAKFKSAANYLLEDELAEPIGAMHVVSLQVAGAGQVLAVRDTIIEAWREAFAAAGIELEGIAPDFLCLPGNSDNTVIAFDGARAICRLGERGFSLDNTLAELVLQSFAREGTLDGAVIYAPDGHALLGLDIPDIDLRRLPHEGLIGLLAVSASAKETPNLLTGKRRARRAFREQARQWRRPAYAASALLGVAAALFIVGGVQDLRKASVYTDLAAELHTKYFPEASASSPYDHARAVLSSTNDLQLLDLTGALVGVLEGVEGVQIDRIRYDQTRGQLIISVRSSDDQNIEALRNQLAAANISARDTGGYRRSDNEWIGDMIIGRI